MNINPIRCAIYTRKSSEEGLDQSFNSLDAQREACASYIQSQRHEGWRLLPTLYDDGGYSGGTMDRPALKQLLTDIDQGLVDLIVVYKVDRLTRSLNDFAKIVDRLDAKSISFVSVTQSFNTTTSMGRLTLNVLLSFAQFEREVTGERIRDKIAASKRKGMWMGGLVPLGYDRKDRQLVINTIEAERVIHIFDRYLALGSVSQLKEELRSHGVRSKSRNGAEEGGTVGCTFSSGALIRILTNPIYRGQVHHHGQLFPGQHPAIVSDELWNDVQAIREQTKRAYHAWPRARRRNPLLGILVNDTGRPFYVSYTLKKGHAPYRYYVLKPDKSDTARKSLRLPAEELEGHVASCLQSYLTDRQRLLDDVIVVSNAGSATERVLAWCQQTEVDTRTNYWEKIRPVLTSVRFNDEGLHMTLDRNAVRHLLGLNAIDEPSSGTVALTWKIRLHRTGHDIRLVIPSASGALPADKPNLSLIRFIAKGQRWYRQFASGEFSSLRAISKAEGVTERYVARLVKGSLLAPDLIEQILDGRQPVTLTVERLAAGFPLDWNEQRRYFGV